jgi:hypothetical protein
MSYEFGLDSHYIVMSGQFGKIHFINVKKNAAESNSTAFPIFITHNL